MNEPSTQTCLIIGVFCLIYAMTQAIKKPRTDCSLPEAELFN